MANDTTLTLTYPAGSTLYTQIRAPDNAIWNGSAYVSYVLANWATYATATPETPASSGFYICQFPTSSAAGNYRWTTYLRSGGSPASTDVSVGSGSGFYSGTTFGNTGAVASLPDPAPDGYGPIGTGSVSVDHDYPTDDNLRFQLAGGQGIGGALVRAYLASEWATNPATATIRGQTLTLADGGWANPIDLDPGSYQITFKHSSFQLYVKALTVS